MAATSVNNDIQPKSDQNQPLQFTDHKVHLAPCDEGDTDVDRGSDIESHERIHMENPSETQITAPQPSLLSVHASMVIKKKPISNSYKFVQLERALQSANLLKKKDEIVKFEHDYLTSLHENKFDEFLQHYYLKIHNHYERIKREEESRKARIFTFVDLEKNFFALDPTRDVKILFVDEPTTAAIARKTYSRSGVSIRQKTTPSTVSNDAAVEVFYDNRVQRFLANPSQAREEITLFARRAGERLHTRLPRMSSVPHRVKIVDERDLSGKPDERTLLEMKHKHTLSVLNQRRSVVLKMVSQTKKNQIKMEKHWHRTPVALDSATRCRELLERASEITEDYERETIRRPQTSIASRKTPDATVYSSNASDMTAETFKTMPSASTSPKPFQDALSIDEVEKTPHVRVLRSTRPVTAPLRVNWVNYC